MIIDIIADTNYQPEIVKEVDQKSGKDLFLQVYLQQEASLKLRSDNLEQDKTNIDLKDYSKNTEYIENNDGSLLDNHLSSQKEQIIKPDINIQKLEEQELDLNLVDLGQEIIFENKNNNLEKEFKKFEGRELFNNRRFDIREAIDIKDHVANEELAEKSINFSNKGQAKENSKMSNLIEPDSNQDFTVILDDENINNSFLGKTNNKSKKSIIIDNYSQLQPNIKNPNIDNKILPKYEVAGHSNDAFVKQMETKIIMMQNNKITAAEISVTPPELGKMEISLQVKNDHINVQIQTASDPIRQLIETNVERLRTNLVGNGIEFANVDVHSQDFTDKNQNDHNNQEYGFIGFEEEQEVYIKRSDHMVSYLV